MHFTPAARVLLLLAAAAAQTTTECIQARDDEGLACLYMTSGVDWTDEGLNLCQVGGVCASELPDGLTANVFSAGPDEGVTCFLYSESDCNGDVSAPIVNPGYADLGDIGFAKMARSWRCWKWCETTAATTTSSAAAAGSSVLGEISTTQAGVVESIANQEEVEISTTLSAVGANFMGNLAKGVDISTTLSAMMSSSSSSVTGASTSTPSVISTTRSSSSQDLSRSSSTQPTATMSTFSTPQIPTPPGIGFFTTTITQTHTYADGNTTVLTTQLVEPIPPTVSSTSTSSPSSSTSVGGFLTASPGDPSTMRVTFWTSTVTLVGNSATLTVTETGAEFAPPA